MKITRQQAIELLDKATDRDDPHWERACERAGLYDESSGDIPTIFDAFSALGVSREEFDAACSAKSSTE